VDVKLEQERERRTERKRKESREKERAVANRAAFIAACCACFIKPNASSWPLGPLKPTITKNEPQRPNHRRGLAWFKYRSKQNGAFKIGN
jgi:hypothetical protein